MAIEGQVSDSYQAMCRELGLLSDDQEWSTVLHYLQLEALERTFRDLMDMPDCPFGGKIIILAEDFWQYLPVVPSENRPLIVKKRTSKWKHMVRGQWWSNLGQGI